MAQIILDSNSNLIQGDFDSATVNNRTKLQTSTTNATTGVYVVPNGTATSASVQIANAADPTNASKLVVATNASTDTQIVSGANGTGTYLPLSFYTNNDIRFQINNSGALGVRTGVGTVGFGTSGQVLTSGGPAAGVSWATAPSGFTNMQVFTTPGTFTTPATTTQIKVTVVGGGGGSTTNPLVSYGGGGGGAAIYVGPVTASTPYAVTVGAAGAAGASGGTSSFGVLASATGGATGSIPTFLGGAGGAGSAGTLQIKGGGGGGGMYSTAPNGPITTNYWGVGGAGGNSMLGSGASGTGNSATSPFTVNGSAGGNYGGGGSGGINNGSSAAGGAGVVIVEY